MSTYYKTRLRLEGQITLPGEIRELLDLKEGDDLAFSVDKNGFEARGDQSYCLTYQRLPGDVLFIRVVEKHEGTLKNP